MRSHRPSLAATETIASDAGRLCREAHAAGEGPAGADAACGLLAWSNKQTPPACIRPCKLPRAGMHEQRAIGATSAGCRMQRMRAQSWLWVEIKGTHLFSFKVEMKCYGKLFFTNPLSRRYFFKETEHDVKEQYI